MSLILRWSNAGLTHAEIGRRLKVTRERVRQIKKLAYHQIAEGMWKENS